MLAAGAESLPLEVRDEWQRTPLVVAAKRGDATIVAYLLAKGADPAVEAEFGVTPSGWSVQNAHFASLAKESFKGHPLSWTVRNNHFQTARILLSHAVTHQSFLAEADAANVFGEPLLHSCVRSQNARLLNMILAFSTWDLDAVDVSGRTAEEVTSSPGIKRVFELARNWEAAAAATPASMTLLEAVASQSFGAIKAVVDRGDVAALNAQDAETGETGLIAAAKAGMGTIVAYLLFAGVDPGLKDKLGSSALHWACLRDHFNVVRILLSHGAVHEPFAAPESAEYRSTINGESVLHMAARSGNPELVKLVLSFDTFTPDLAALNLQNQSPKDVAMEPDVRRILKSATSALEAGEASAGLPMAERDFMIPLTPRTDSRVCSVCLSAPSVHPSSILYTCSCLAVICDRCLGETVARGLDSGDGFPKCQNVLCARRVPLHIISDRLPASRQLDLIAVVVNEKLKAASSSSSSSSSSAEVVETVTRVPCRICQRDNVLEEATKGSKSPAYACKHCGVNLCAVCNNIFPKSNVDTEIHSACITKFPYLAAFNKLQDVIAAASFHPCPTCGKQPAAEAGETSVSDVRVSCPCGVEYCGLCGKAHAAEGEGVSCPASVEALSEIHASLSPESVAAVRVRAAILGVVEEMGIPHFTELASVFKLMDALNAEYFNGIFPLDEDDEGWSETGAPSWIAFEPQEVWELWSEWAGAWVGAEVGDLEGVVAVGEVV